MSYEIEVNPGAFPQRITLELTNRCNLNCTFCPRKYMEAERGNMDTGLALRLIDEIAEHAPVQIVPFFRGETLLHPEWQKIIAYMKHKNIGQIHFTTNATLLTMEATAAILGLDLDFISFSMDTTDAHLYNSTRRGADYSTCLNNVLSFIEERNRRGSSLQIQVSAVETDRHKPFMDAFVDFWRERADRVRIYAEHSADGKPGSIDAPLPAFDRRKPCRKLFSDMVVYWNGEIAVCNHDWTRLVTGPHIGNAKTSDLAACWLSPAYAELRRRHMHGDFSGTSVCEGCDHWKMYYLESGFLGRVYENTGTMRQSTSTAQNLSAQESPHPTIHSRTQR